MNMVGTALPRAIPWQRLALLTLAVLAAHLLLLQAAPDAWQPAEAPAARAQPMITRTLTPAAQPAPPPPAPPRGGPPRRARAAPPPADPAEAAVAEAPAAPPAEEAPAPAAENLAGNGTPPPAESAAPPAPAAEAAGPETTVGPAVVAPAARLVYELVGEVRQMQYHAEAELLWRHDGRKYEARLTVSAFLIGSRSQSSEGSLTPQGLAPSRFSDKKRRGEQATHFDRARERIVFSANTPEAPLLPGAQDRLSLLLQLGALLGGDPQRFAPGAQITIQTAGPREAEPWQFTVEGSEVLSVAGRSVDALKLLRQPRKAYDIRVELWLDRAPPHLPLRMRITQSNGDYLDQALRAVEPL